MKPVSNSQDTDQYWMGQALELAKTVLCTTSPNPRVGCIVVRNGEVLGSGATQPTGHAHAEIMALQQAQTRGFTLQGATVYVTLEPCSHYGRTPPCVDALIQAQPARVVIAMADPNPLVGGQGIARLRQAGITVAVGEGAEQALALNPGFVARMTRGRPWVWLKLAASMDGYIALSNGESKWITGAAARADGHSWRARSCVVLTGSGTVAADNPQLTVRDAPTSRQPIRAIVDTRFETSEDAQMLDGGPVWIFTSRSDPEKAQRLARKNVEIVLMPKAGKRVDLHAVLTWMAQRDVNEVHVEAGSRLSGAFMDAGCVDELVLYMAPVFLAEGIPMARMHPLASLAQAQRFQLMSTEQIGDDLRVCLRHPDHWRELCKLAKVPSASYATIDVQQP